MNRGTEASLLLCLSRESCYWRHEAFMQNLATEENFTGDPRVTVANAASRPLTPTQKYRPTLPAKSARRISVLRQALYLPKTLLAIYKIIREDFTTPVLDEKLLTFLRLHPYVVDPEPWAAPDLT